MSPAVPVVPRVVVIGLDCLSPDLVFDRYRDDLPTFRALMAAGRWGRLRSVDPPVTIPAWSCMLSGRTPPQLGLYGFRHRKLGSYHEHYLADSRHVRAPRVWDVLCDNGWSVGLLGVPQTWPLFPVRGFVVGDAPDGTQRLAFPEDLEPEIRRVVGDYHPDVRGFRSADPAEVLEDIQAVTDQKFALFQHLIATRGGDFLMMVDMGPDRMHHRFFRHCDPSHRLHQQVAALPDPVRAYYRRLDAHLARTLEWVPDTTHVLVVSDHGARSLRGGFCINDWLIERGLLTLRSPARAPRPFDESMVDWKRTLAWAWGGYHGRIFVNLQGREPEGQVSAAELDSFLDQLSQDLAAIPSPDGRPMGNRVLRFMSGDGDASAQGDYPDLMVYFGDLSWRALGSVGHDGLFTEGNDTGPDDANHDPMGVLIHRGPVPWPGDEQQGLSILDVAPAILRWFGLQLPR